MTPNLQMASLSLAGIRAVAADAGCKVSIPDSDTDSVDGLILFDSGRRPRLEFQAKATTRDVLRGGDIHFPLPVNNYNDLRVVGPVVPRVLIVLLMPVEPERWLSQTSDALSLRHCLYWHCIEGEPDKPNTNNVTVVLPEAQKFDKAQLHSLMGKVERGEPLC